MAYTSFVDNKPDITDAGQDVIDDTRENIMALRDAIASGRLEDWDMTTSGGTAEEPGVLQWRDGQGSGTDRVRATITWGTSGGADGNPTVIVYAFSINGSTWDTIGTLTITYDANGNVTASAWS